MEKSPFEAVILVNLKVGSGPFITVKSAITFFRLLPVFKSSTVKFNSFKLLIVGLFSSYIKWILTLFSLSTQSWIFLLAVIVVSSDSGVGASICEGVCCHHSYQEQSTQTSRR